MGEHGAKVLPKYSYAVWLMLTCLPFLGVAKAELRTAVAEWLNTAFLGTAVWLRSTCLPFLVVVGVCCKRQLTSLLTKRALPYKVFLCDLSAKRMHEL